MFPVVSLMNTPPAKGQSMRPAQRWTLHAVALAVGIPALTRSIVDTVNGKNPLTLWLIVLIIVLLVTAAIYVGVGFNALAQTKAVLALHPNAKVFAFTGGSSVWEALTPEPTRASTPLTLGVIEIGQDELRVWHGTGYPELVATIPYTSISSIESQDIRDGLRLTRKLVFALQNTRHQSIAITIMRPRSLFARAAPASTVDDVAATLELKTAHKAT